MNKSQEEFYKKILNFAEERSGECLSNEYQTGNQVMEFKCSNHEHGIWKTKAKYILQGCWCKQCMHDSFRNSEGLNSAYEIAESHGGKCLSNEYHNAHTKLKFKCKNENHQIFESNLATIKNKKRWCPQCSLENRIDSNLINVAKEEAIKNGGECLSTEYKHSKNKLVFKCSNPKHSTWSTRLEAVLDGHWCPECGRETTKSKTKLSDGLEQANNYAKENGGVCLSKQYVNASTKMTWKCSNPEHQPWEASFSHTVSSKKWCKECANTKRRLFNDIESVHDFAKSKDGKCLSSEYINSKTPMIWKCSNKNHSEFKLTFNEVSNRHLWCKECYWEERKNGNLQIAKQHATSKGGECLSSTFNTIKDDLLWKCSNASHKPWKSNFRAVVKKDIWCPTCSGRHTQQEWLEIAKQHAISKGGQCLSTQYINSTSMMTWKCSNPEHDPWNQKFSHIYNSGSWCPQCSSNLSERRTRLLFETYFGKPFPSSWLDWNINPLTKEKLELDGYCEVFNVAFEHDGEHHFRLGFNQKPYEFTEQKIRDFQKKKNCQKQGITLINIPIANKKDRNKFQPFLSHVIKHCQAQGLPMSFTDQQLLELEDRFNKI